MDATLVLDAGKTLTKLTVFDSTGKQLASARRRNAPPGRQLDTDGIAAWLAEAAFGCAPSSRLPTAPASLC